MLLFKVREDLMDISLGGNLILYKLFLIKNIILVYVVFKVISKGDSVEYGYGNIYFDDGIILYISNVENNFYYKIFGMILKIILVIVVIVVLVFLYRKFKELLGFDILLRILLEIFFIVFVII